MQNLVVVHLNDSEAKKHWENLFVYAQSICVIANLIIDPFQNQLSQLIKPDWEGWSWEALFT